MSRVNEIRYVGYGVKDLEAEKAFYLEKWGLVQVPSTDGLTWLATQAMTSITWCACGRTTATASTSLRWPPLRAPTWMRWLQK